jgi:CcmD family protein
MNGYVLAANLVIWLALGAYGLSLALRGRALAARLKQLEILRDADK